MPSIVTSWPTAKPVHVPPSVRVITPVELMLTIACCGGTSSAISWPTANPSVSHDPVDRVIVPFTVAIEPFTFVAEHATLVTVLPLIGTQLAPTLAVMCGSGFDPKLCSVIDGRVAAVPEPVLRGVAVDDERRRRAGVVVGRAGVRAGAAGCERARAAGDRDVVAADERLRDVAAGQAGRDRAAAER